MFALVNDPDLTTWFFTLFLHFWATVEDDPIYSIYIREEKNRDIVFRESTNNMEAKPISPKGVVCLGVYYTRDNTYKDCYIRQERAQ